MEKTLKIPEDRLEAYFDAFTKQFLLPDPSRQAADIEIISPDLGGQLVSLAHLVGISYDRHAKALEFALQSGDHRAFNPKEVWVLEEADGFVSAVEIVRADGEREIVTIKHIALRPLE